MNTKLTLNVDKIVIEEAKIYAKENNISLSKLFENYINAISRTSSKTGKASPLVKSLTGIIPDEKIDLNSAYTDYLSKKYS
ncbi:MAG: DUF6364 family protein [Tannerella sp.]|jgi:hypothetical protein|nr:DUF6364 family protein [Tannerella sp.]